MRLEPAEGSEVDLRTDHRSAKNRRRNLEEVLDEFEELLDEFSRSSSRTARGYEVQWRRQSATARGD
jgi:hypothetical protein